VKLTERIIARLDLPTGVKERLIGDDDLTGLSLRLRRGSAGIVRSWVFRYSHGGGRHKESLDVAGHNLAAARQWAGRLQARVRLGENPSQGRVRARAEAEQTVGAVLQSYLPQKKLKLRERPYREIERHLLVHFKPLHRIPLRQVTIGDIGRHYLRISGNGHAVANNSWRSLSAFFGWSMRQGFVDRNPCLGVERYPDRKRDRVLSAGEIRALWAATEGSDDHSAILRLLLLSGARASEIGGLLWEEIRSDRLDLPAARMKSNKPHVIYLTPTMRTILDTRERRPDKPHVFGRLRDRPFVGWGGSKLILDERIRAAGVVMSAPWIVHDLRRTFATGTSELGVTPYVVEGCLGHATFRPGIAARYNHSQLEGPIRHALNVWDAHIKEIVEGRIDGDRVVPLRA
jgi:integrase